jgi:transcriptional regulator with XRE-family HTH domain
VVSASAQYDDHPFPETAMRAAYGDRLAKLLEEEKAQGIDEANVARDIGVPTTTLSRWKKEGHLSQDLDVFLLLCRRLRTHPNYLLGWDDQRYPDKEPLHAAEFDAALKANRRGRRG